jgi:hypothetical protein
MANRRWMEKVLVRWRHDSYSGVLLMNVIISKDEAIINMGALQTNIIAEGDHIFLSEGLIFTHPRYGQMRYDLTSTLEGYKNGIRYKYRKMRFE